MNFKGIGVTSKSVAAICVERDREDRPSKGRGVLCCSTRSISSPLWAIIAIEWKPWKHCSSEAQTPDSGVVVGGLVGLATLKSWKQVIDSSLTFHGWVSVESGESVGKYSKEPQRVWAYVRVCFANTHTCIYKRKYTLMCKHKCYILISEYLFH